MAMPFGVMIRQLKRTQMLSEITQVGDSLLFVPQKVVVAGVVTCFQCSWQRARCLHVVAKTQRKCHRLQGGESRCKWQHFDVNLSEGARPWL
jgi:hypothetical protein